MKELFDYPSIEVNKQGRQSEAQIKLIKEATSPRIWLGDGLALLVLGGCFYSFLIAIEAGDSGGIFGLILGAAGLAAFLRGAAIWNLNRKLLAEPVQSAEGQVIFTTQEYTDHDVDFHRFIAQTNDKKLLYLLGLAGASLSLPPGKYRFYYLNTRNWLLSAEPLSSEEDLRESLNETLAYCFGYDMAHLEQCRQEAREGKLIALEDQPVIEMVERLGIKIVAGKYNKNIEPRFFCIMGDVKFLIPRVGSYAIFKELKHRVYYRETESDTVFGNLMNLMKNKRIEAVEIA